MTTPWPLQRRHGEGFVPRRLPVAEQSVHNSSRETVIVLVTLRAASASSNSTSTLRSRPR
jgi:hypothetical protein